MSQDFSIRSYPPGTLDSAVNPTPEDARPAPWVTRVTHRDGSVFVLGLEAPHGFGHLLDPVSVPAIAADILRAGWVEIARPHTRPVVTDGTIFRGFSLERDASLYPEVRGTWRLECLMPSDVRVDFDWPLKIQALDAFHTSVFNPR